MMKGEVICSQISKEGNIMKVGEDLAIGSLGKDTATATEHSECYEM